jgi:ferredoxin
MDGAGVSRGERRSSGRGGTHMTFVVTQPCHDCKYTDCVPVCPTEAFYQDEVMLYINPEECICCGACVVECPVEAIFDEPDVPAKWFHYVELNRERTAALAAQGGDAHIIEQQEPKLGPGCGGHA